jgi:hypothetical protein
MEAVVAYFIKVISRQLPGRTEENYRKPQVMILNP